MSHCERICPAFCRHWPSICPASRTPFTSVLACSLRAFCVHLASLVKHSACVRHAMGRLFLRAFRLPSASLLHASGEHLLVCPFLCLVFARTAKSKKISTLLDLCVSSLRRGHANLLCIVPILTDDPRRESKWPCTAPLGCIAFLQPSRSLQTARAPGRLFLGLASAALSRHFACARRRDCQGQRQECDTCGVRTHADRSTRT